MPLPNMKYGESFSRTLIPKEFFQDRWNFGSMMGNGRRYQMGNYGSFHRVITLSSTRSFRFSNWRDSLVGTTVAWTGLTYPWKLRSSITDEQKKLAQTKGNPPERDGMNLKKVPCIDCKVQQVPDILKRPSYAIYRLSSHHVLKFSDASCLSLGKEVLSIEKNLIQERMITYFTHHAGQYYPSPL